MNLKIGGSNVGKIMYGGQEFGGATKLEPGTILYMSSSLENPVKNVHLLSTTKNWSNLNSINIEIYSNDFGTLYDSINIPSDDFKNLDIEKKYVRNGHSTTVSRSIVDGEYRLNINTFNPIKFIIKAI
ncbi:hypothetical protein [Companilactobacillus farciminis]|uniref:hypothetical protein n=1 Tax=Companilactobacillus farciminis TaxID=1612 RepID=UPI00241CC70D|nr:hypothetical protein [Companilactobacillus farciminis]